MYAGRLFARADAIPRSISWTQLSGVITAETHAACAEMFAKFWNSPSPSVWWMILRTRWWRIVGMPTRWKTHDRSALAPITPFSADNSPTAYVVESIEQPPTRAYPAAAYAA